MFLEIAVNAVIAGTPKAVIVDIYKNEIQK